MRIVIVGEDVGQAGAFEQALADFGLDWQAQWLADPAQALNLPADAVIDVFVAGMQAGPLPGPVLLAQLAALYPQAVRVLLLEDRDAALLQGLDCAHRLLSRPLRAEELIEAVESVADLRQMLDGDELKQAIGRIGSLPPPPRLYLELTRLLRDPDASNAAIAQTLSQDPAIVAKVLRLCNSAYFSGGRETTDIRAAVTRLGHQALLRLVLASETFHAPQFGGGVDRAAMQDRALRTSRLARRLLAGPSAELAATAGLLAEVGRLLPGVAAQEGDAGPHYAEAGAYLLGLWGLPMPIVEGVAYHHRPARLRSTGFWVAGAVHVAAALVAGTPVDEAYLRSVGMIDRLPQWRDMVEPPAQEAA
ncbi:HDOD domain-containing protein [Vulcaniibacterium tengchongense]|uniref:HD-like signal output (HDOD) protein n=1 Tax=Vulcaniibacterium tengchongense TaxID=1273429 RepID=A0A3N4VME8_9GAMM|nr:HDOD domain-containing protein [Vulcaniibacterium tengchongense]RPE80969.1 HD-like signal output (HDOD) protein [Vulcaniibacterium tengchongense]